MEQVYKFKIDELIAILAMYNRYSTVTKHYGLDRPTA